MRVISWLIRAFIFFTLFAFALNNRQLTTVHWFFGVQWRAPLVIVVLAAFAAGCAVGVLAMLPGAWQRWRLSRRRLPRMATAKVPVPPHATPTGSVLPSEFGTEHPPRVGP
ncbi:MAG: LapA family protein [Rubrivivax sp.]|nr:LapA family protein [Rubrivivax sp.]